MHKNDLIKQVAEETDVSSRDAEAVVNAVFTAIANTISGGEKVVVTGFGTFERKTRKARKGRHPSTGAVIDIPQKFAASFSPGKLLKEQVEKG